MESLRANMLELVQTYLHIWNTKGPAGLTAIMSPDLKIKVSPKSLGLNTPDNLHAYIAVLQEGQKVSGIKNYKFSLATGFDPVIDTGARRIVLHVQSIADSSFGSVENEFMVTFKTSENGKQIVEQYEFVDSSAFSGFVGKLQVHLKSQDPRSTQFDASNAMPALTVTDRVSAAYSETMAAELKTHFIKELQSFKSPPPKPVAALPKVGEPAPTVEKLKLPGDKPTIVVFLRHCGCPFAEKTFRSLTQFANVHHDFIHSIAVSHSSQEATDNWIPQVGGAWETEVVVDEEREAYAAWGLGLSSYWHAMGPFSIYSAVQLGKSEGIWNRTTESGTKWQTSGAFAIDRGHIVRWVSIARSASDIPDLDAALRALIEAPKQIDPPHPSPREDEPPKVPPKDTVPPQVPPKGPPVELRQSKITQQEIEALNRLIMEHEAQKQGGSPKETESARHVEDSRETKVHQGVETPKELKPSLEVDMPEETVKVEVAQAISVEKPKVIEEHRNFEAISEAAPEMKPIEAVEAHVETEAPKGIDGSREIEKTKEAEQRSNVADPRDFAAPRDAEMSREIGAPTDVETHGNTTAPGDIQEIEIKRDAVASKECEQIETPRDAGAPQEIETHRETEDFEYEDTTKEVQEAREIEVPQQIEAHQEKETAEDIEKYDEIEALKDVAGSEEAEEPEQHHVERPDISARKQIPVPHVVVESAEAEVAHDIDESDSEHEASATKAHAAAQAPTQDSEPPAAAAPATVVKTTRNPTEETTNALSESDSDFGPSDDDEAPARQTQPPKKETGQAKEADGSSDDEFKETDDIDSDYEGSVVEASAVATPVVAAPMKVQPPKIVLEPDFDYESSDDDVPKEKIGEALKQPA